MVELEVETGHSVRHRGDVIKVYMVYEVPGGGDYQWQQASGLNETMYDRLRFANDKNEAQQLQTFTDSSFAPSSGRSHGSVTIFYGSCPLSWGPWRSARQPLVALSTAETELMEGVEGVVMAYSTKCLLDELVGRTLPIFAHLPPHRQQCCDRRADFCGGKLEDTSSTTTRKLDKGKDSDV